MCCIDLRSSQIKLTYVNELLRSLNALLRIFEIFNYIKLIEKIKILYHFFIVTNLGISTLYDIKPLASLFIFDL